MPHDLSLRGAVFERPRESGEAIWLLCCAGQKNEIASPLSGGPSLLAMTRRTIYVAMYSTAKKFTHDHAPIIAAPMP